MNLPRILLGIFLIAWFLLAINPAYRHIWFIENIVIFLAFPMVLWSYFKFRLSNFSYFLIFALAMIHIFAAHWGYWNTPWGNWLSGEFGWERNNLDRIVHFLFGLTMAPVGLDLLRRYLKMPAWVQAIFVFSVVFSIGSLYEIAEYIVGITTRPEIGMDFLGFQGDIWDTQKDIILQGIGAIIGIFFSFIFGRIELSKIEQESA